MVAQRPEGASTDRGGIVVACSAVAICMLCQRSAELQNSHLLSAALYRRALDRSSQNPHPVLFSVQGEHQTSRQARKPLLCQDCEQLFHRRGEDWTLRHAATTPTTFPLRDILLSHEAHRITGNLHYFCSDRIPSVDADAMGYFALSIIWRAAVCDWKIDGKLIPQLRLGHYAAALRTYLLGLNSVSVKATPSLQPADAFDALGVWTSNDNDQDAGEGERKPTGWRLSVKRAGSAGRSFATSEACR